MRTQRLKPLNVWAFFGAAEAAPFQSNFGFGLSSVRTCFVPIENSRFSRVELDAGLRRRSSGGLRLGVGRLS